MSRKLMLQLLGMTAGLTLSAWGHAVGLGGINVVSALGQPLKAEIELVAVGKTDKPGLVARLASPDAYKGAGLDYPYGIKYSFEVGNRANGEPYLKLSSNREITDPFVSLLVELSWSSGKLMREYTFLLDPPGYAAAQPKPAAIQEVIPAAVQSAPAIVIKIEEEKPVASAPVARQVEMPAEKPVEKPVEKTVPKRFEVEKRATQAKPEGAATGTISVKHGDSLNKIAAEVKPDDVSLDRMLVALYRANADQFDGKNMNRIKSGKILRMPDHDEIMNVVQAEAVQEIHAQSADWNAYRQKLAGAATTSRETEAPRQVAAGKITSTTADKTPVAAPSAKEVLRLSKGETPGDKTGAAGRAKIAQDKSNAAAEEAIAKGKAVNEEKIRAALLDSNLKDMQRLAQLKAEAASLAANAAAAKATAEVVSPAASAVAAASEVVAASQVAAASQVQAASHVAAASSVKPAATKEASLLDQLLDSPIALGLGAVVLLALGGLGIALNRRRQAGVAEGADAGATTGQLTSPVVPSPETGDFTAVATSSDEVATHADDIDPISEADLFLNFGRDEQAEEVLKDALQHSPDNHQIHLKLLGIYANRGDAASFEKIARLLQDSGDDEAMQQASAMGRKLDPTNPMYGGEAADADIAALLTEVAVLTGPDSADEPMSFEIAEPETVEALEEDEFAPVEAIDFDVTATHPMAVQADEVDFDVTSAMPSLAAPDTVDFDIAAKEPETDHLDEEAQPSLDDLIFDVMSPPGAPVEAGAEPSAENAAEDDGMEFTLDFPVDEADVKAAPVPASVNLADISLDMDDVGVPAPAPEALPEAVEKSEHWHEVATKIDLARAYQEMGDEVGAREILDEVMLEGDDAQQQEAQLLISQLN